MIIIPISKRKTVDERLLDETPKEAEGLQEPKESLARSATFINFDVPDASLYWEDQFWSKMEFNQNIDVNTFVGKHFTIKIFNVVEYDIRKICNENE